jgi:GPH family glycoside/pentoside/hexuronide:cation symporter
LASIAPVIAPVIAEGAASERLGLRLIVGWAIGTFAIGILFNTTGMLLLRYLTDYVGLAAGIAVTDPLMGWVSDNTRSRFGRRRPWLLLGTFMCGLAIVGLFNIPSAWSGGLLVGWVVLMLLFYASAYTVFTVPYMAMPAEMTTDYHERSRLMSYRVAFICSAQLVAGYAAPMLIVAFGDGSRGHGRMSFVLAAGIIVCGLACFSTSSTMVQRSAGDGVMTGATVTPRIGGMAQLRAVIGNRPFVILIVSKLALLLAVASFGATFAYFVVHVLKATYALLGTYTIVSSAAMFVSLPVWMKVIKRTDKRRTFLIASALYAAMSLSWLLASAGDPVLWTLLRGVAMGILGCGTLLAGQALLPDAIEYDYLRHGERREALFAGFYTMAEKLASAFGLAMIGTFLGYMGYLSSSGGALVQQPDSALLGISLAVGGLPALMLLVSGALLWSYDLSEEKLAALRAARRP